MKRTLMMAMALLATCVVALQAEAVMPNTKTIERVRLQFRKYAPTKIAAEAWQISDKDRKFLAEVVAAAGYMDEIFLRQVWEDNPRLREQLVREGGGTKHILLTYFDLNAGPFDRLDEHKAFLDIGIDAQPPTAGFYPTDLTKNEWDAWLDKHPGDREDFKSTYTVIERDGRKLKAVPYAAKYAGHLKPAAKHLRAAAKLAGNASLKKYLTSRAKAFETNDYYQSDMDWMNLSGHDYEVVIGPYEVYEDRFMGYKAAFEAYVAMVDKKESERLGRIKTYMGAFEQHLPIDDAYKNTKRGGLSPIVVANLLYSAGDAKAGIQTLAFNLPNDEKVREALGSKKVMLKNVSEAKFKEILTPIAKLTMSRRDAANISFDAFFNHTLVHEISHGIGPGTITVKGAETTVNLALKDLYSVIEEAKADTLGLYNNLYLIEKGMYAKGYERTLMATYLAGLFRSMRFGIGEAHGGGNAIQFNYLKQKKAIVFDRKAGTFSLDEDRMHDAIASLARELLMIEAKGSYAKAKSFVKSYRTMPKELKSVLAKLTAVPVDIRPIYSSKLFEKK